MVLVNEVLVFAIVPCTIRLVGLYNGFTSERTAYGLVHTNCHLVNNLLTCKSSLFLIISC